MSLDITNMYKQPATTIDCLFFVRYLTACILYVCVLAQQNIVRAIANVKPRPSHSQLVADHWRFSHPLVLVVGTVLCRIVGNLLMTIDNKLK
jgi:hypothetical protein